MSLPTVGTFYVFCMSKKKCNSFLYFEAIILIRLLWLPDISKICVSSADKYIMLIFDLITSPFPLFLFLKNRQINCLGQTK